MNGKKKSNDKYLWAHRVIIRKLAFSKKSPKQIN
jgi:hypothetical protein